MGVNNDFTDFHKLDSEEVLDDLANKMDRVDLYVFIIDLLNKLSNLNDQFYLNGMFFLDSQFFSVYCVSA